MVGSKQRDPPFPCTLPLLSPPPRKIKGRNRKNSKIKRAVTYPSWRQWCLGTLSFDHRWVTNCLALGWDHIKTPKMLLFSPTLLSIQKRRTFPISAASASERYHPVVSSNEAVNVLCGVARRVRRTVLRGETKCQKFGSDNHRLNYRRYTLSLKVTFHQRKNISYPIAKKKKRAGRRSLSCAWSPPTPKNLGVFVLESVVLHLKKWHVISGHLIGKEMRILWIEAYSSIWSTRVTVPDLSNVVGHSRFAS